MPVTPDDGGLHPPSPPSPRPAPLRSAVLDADLDSLDVPSLEALVRHHNHLYWDRAAPEISDTEYDRLVRRLKELAPSSSVLTEMGPSGDGEGRYGAPVTHAVPMLSLDKAYGDDEIREWMSDFEGRVVVSPKFDGVAASLRYDASGELVLAATRGNGVTGDDITANARAVRDIPRTIKLPTPAPVEVRGEVFMKLSVFAGYKDRFANPRNLTAGAIKQKDAKKSAAYGLSFAAYEIFGLDLPTEHEKIDLLADIGFPRIERVVVEKDRVLEVYRELAARRSELDYEIDGVVMKVDRVDEQKRLGSTAHHPRFAIAYKFQGDAGTTKLREVEWSVARTGAITPVALVDPVALSGVLVGRASLHHPGYIGKLGLTLGAEVLITRRGGVIPNVEHVVKPGTTEIPIPTSCPSCGGPVRAEGDFLYCAKPEDCRAAKIGAVAHYLAVADIEGFGDRMLGELFDRKLVRDVPDLYRLTVKDLLPIERVGDKLAKKLVAAMDARRTLPLETFLRALGIDELGKHVSKILASEFGTLERVLTVTPAELSAIHSIGDVIAQNVTAGLAASRDRIAAIREHVTVEEGKKPAAAPTTGPFVGQSFVFTGKMAKCKREEAQALVQKLGGMTPDAVSKTTTYLVIGDDKSDGKKSSKEKAADKLVAGGGAIRIISESDFLAMAGADGG